MWLENCDLAKLKMTDVLISLLCQVKDVETCTCNVETGIFKAALKQYAL